MPEKPQYMARVIISKLDATGEKIETMVKAKDLEGLKTKLVGIVSLMDEGDL